MTYRAAWGLAVLCFLVAPVGLSNAQDLDPDYEGGQDNEQQE